jgi:hypothetical protein
VPEHRHKDRSGLYWPEDNGRALIIDRVEDPEDLRSRILRRLHGQFGATQLLHRSQIDAPICSRRWHRQIDRLVSESSVALVLLNHSCVMGMADKHSAVLDEREPFRLQVERALREKDLRVVPVLLGGMEVPLRSQLPRSMGDLVGRNGWLVRSDTFEQDVARLSPRLSKYVGVPRDMPRPEEQWEAHFIERAGGLVVIRTDLSWATHTIRFRCATLVSEIGVANPRRGRAIRSEFKIWVDDRNRPVSVRRPWFGAWDAQFKIRDGNVLLRARIRPDSSEGVGLSRSPSATSHSK